MNARSAITAGIVGIVALSALGVALNSSDTHENKLRIAYFPNIGHAVPIVGIEQGYFADELGSDIEIELEFLIVDPGHRIIVFKFSRYSICWTRSCN